MCHTFYSVHTYFTVMANGRDPNILEIAEICKSVGTAFEYAKNCGLVVDVAAVGAQTTTYCTYCILLDVVEHCTIQLFVNFQKFVATAVRNIAVQ